MKARLGVALLAIAGLLGACDDALSGGPRGGRGVSTPAPVPVPLPEGEPVEAPRAPRPRLLGSEAERSPGADNRALAGEAAPGGTGAAAEEATEARRDLSADLQRAFGAPTGCLSEATRDGLEGELAVQVSVRVTPTGRVVSADVTSGALPEPDRACMERHALGVRIAGPVEDAPRAVSATIRYRVQDGRVSTTTRELPQREYGPGTLNPDSTLPAAGSATERPAGSVSPSRTLPAQVPAERPPGFVPPSRTLPAQGN